MNMLRQGAAHVWWLISVVNPIHEERKNPIWRTASMRRGCEQVTGAFSWLLIYVGRPSIQAGLSCPREKSRTRTWKEASMQRSSVVSASSSCLGFLPGLPSVTNGKATVSQISFFFPQLAFGLSQQQKAYKHHVRTIPNNVQMLQFCPTGPPFISTLPITTIMALIKHLEAAMGIPTNLDPC